MTNDILHLANTLSENILYLRNAIELMQSIDKAKIQDYNAICKNDGFLPIFDRTPKLWLSFYLLFKDDVQKFSQFIDDSIRNGILIDTSSKAKEADLIVKKIDSSAYLLSDLLKLNLPNRFHYFNDKKGSISSLTINDSSSDVRRNILEDLDELDNIALVAQNLAK